MWIKEDKPWSPDQGNPWKVEAVGAAKDQNSEQTAHGQESLESASGLPGMTPSSPTWSPPGPEGDVHGGCALCDDGGYFDDDDSGAASRQTGTRENSTATAPASALAPDLEATEPETFVPPRPQAPQGWLQGNTVEKQARWLMAKFPTPEGKDPNIIGNLADLPYVIPKDVFEAVCRLW